MAHDLPIPNSIPHPGVWDFLFLDGMGDNFRHMEARSAGCIAGHLTPAIRPLVKPKFAKPQIACYLFQQKGGVL